MAEFASKGVAGAGLGTGIAGLALGVLNSSNNGNGLLGGTIAGMMGTLNNITKTIVPASAICPAPMPLHNSWVAPTTTTTPAA